MSRKPNGYWTYERCKEEVKKYKNRNDLKSNNKSLHNIIYENKWHELFSHMKELKLKNGYWNYNNCKKHALECNSKSEFFKKYNGGYKTVSKNKWFELYSHMEVFGNMKKRLVYVYEFSDNHCYVGLTGNIKRRNNQHTNSDMKSNVNKHLKETNLIPKLITISDYIEDIDAILLEEITLNKYKYDGWIILNEVKTGGLGSTIIKWNKENCIKEIEKYTKLLDFQLNSPGAYYSCIKNKWKEELCKNLIKRTPRGFFNNKERCENEAKKYKNRTEFQKSWSAYYYSLKNGWIDDFFSK
jgi:predicted GIY-YIG superfamily endonuclease